MTVAAAVSPKQGVRAAIGDNPTDEVFEGALSPLEDQQRGVVTMAKIPRIQQAIALAVTLMLAAPIAAFAADGKKHFKEGMKYEENRQWDKAAQEFALAAAEKPNNVEYTLHLQRALVSAAIMLVERGDTLAEKKDYNAAYNAYRQAFSFDPTNELALIKMRRMLEAQGLPIDNLPKTGDPAGPSYKPNRDQNVTASYTSGTSGGVAAPATQMRVQMPAIPGRRFSRTDVIYRDTNILTAIEQLAQMMKLNVMFDQMVVNQMKMLKITVELRDVTYPRALEMILKTNNLMYAQIDTRTIVVASDVPQQRQKYEPFAVRTFYIKNAVAEEVKGAIGGALPASKQVTAVKQLNALIVRDTPANLELVDTLINSLDKAKAEVLIDVNIYEVSRNNILQLGNQFTNDSSATQVGLSALGGINAQRNILGLGARTLTGPLGFAVGLPNSSISFFQDKGKAKLLASTQVHVLDDQDQSIRIGQRVPIQTATLPSFSNVTPQTQRQGAVQNGLNPADQLLGLNGAFGAGIPQIQYENVGLNIDMKPKVFEDEVEMKMKIDSTSLDRSTGTFTPSFNQRTMTTMARVKDGQTTMVAGVSQDEQSHQVKGLPLIGLIPILGRFFATPSTTNRQSDVIITVTPHILRRADITEQDHLARLAGDSQTSSNQLKIEQILYLADQEDAQPNQVAETARPATPEAKPQPVSAPPLPVVNTRSEPSGVVVTPPPTAQPQSLKPNVIKMTVSKPGVQTGSSGQGSPGSQANRLADDDDDDEEAATSQQPAAPLMVTVRPNTATATKGQDLYVAIFVAGNGDLASAHITLNYDGSLLEVKGVRDSGMLGAGSRAELQFSHEGGVLSIQMDRTQGAGGVPARGQLCLVHFGVKAPGQSPLLLNAAQAQFRNSAGLALPIRVQSSQVDIR
jgi:general secretion pathway protein D